MSSLKTRFGSRLSRMNCRTFSTGIITLRGQALAPDRSQLANASSEELIGRPAG